MTETSKHWIEDCKYWWGRVLDGPKAHWCADWDDLPIDENCDEFKGCSCYVKTETGTDPTLRGV